MPEGLLWRPFFPPVPILLGAAVLAVLALWAFWRTFRQAPLVSTLALPMRLSLMAAAVALLLGPSFLPEVLTLPGRPRVTFMIDTSASMQTPDVASRSRYDFAVQTWLSPDRLARLGQVYDVEVLAFDDGARAMPAGTLYRPAEQVATAGVSNVLGSVSAAVADLPAPAADSPGAAVVLISDGRDTGDTGDADGDAAISLFAGARRTPVHTVALGGPNLQRDLAVVAVPLQEYLLAGEEGQIAVRVIGSGVDGAATTLRLRGPTGETTLPVQFADDGAVRFSLPVKHEQPGLYEYEVLVDALPGEVEARNNAQPVFVAVTKQRLEILLLEGAPYWDTKFLAQSLRKDDRIELTQIVQVSDAKQQKLVSRVDASTAASSAEPAKTARQVPQTLAEMRRYDVIVLGGGMEHVLTPETARLLVSYVTEYGGRLVFARGRCYDAASPRGALLARELGPVEPVVWGEGLIRDMRLTLDAFGESHPAFAFADGAGDRRRLVSELPGLLTAPLIEREKAAAQVLARTAYHGLGIGGGQEGQPAIVTMPCDRGMVLAVLGEGLWKWSLVGREQKRLAGVFDRFWSNNIRWLVMGSDFQPGRELSVRLSERSVQVGERVYIDVTDRDAVGDAPRAVSLAIVGPGGQQQQPVLEDVGQPSGSGRWRAAFEPETPGVYHVLAAAPGLEKPVESSFNVYELDLERLECSANPRLMRLLAEETGGRALDPFDPDALERILERQRQAAIVPPRPQYLWNQGWIMAAMLTWGGAEWILRKKGGLL